MFLCDTSLLISAELIQPEVFQTYLRSERATSARKFLQDRQYDCKLSLRDEHALVRNYIIINMLLHNGSRSGIIKELVMSNYTAARKKGATGGNYVIHVTKHKTLESHGAAQLVLPEDIFQLLSSYIEIRKKLPNYSEAMEADLHPVLVNYTGSHVTQSDVANLLTRELETCGLQADRASSRTIRKAAVTHVSMKFVL